MSKVQDAFTKIFIQRIEERRLAGETVVAPWKKMWNPALGADRNLVTGKAYRGGNVFMTAIQGYSSPFWASRKQITAAGGTINKQDDGKLVGYTPILFWNFPTPEQKAAGRFPFCKFYQVWNIEQTTGLEALAASKLEAFDGEVLNPIEEAQSIVDGWHGKPVIGYGNSRAFYTPTNDTVSMPDLQAFENAEAFYHTLFHELAHSTGHRTRLARDGVVNPVRFGSHDYSEEELVAEMTAGLLAAHAGIDSEDADANSAAYLDHWLAKLKREPSWLSQAGGQAQKAADLIRGIKWEKPGNPAKPVGAKRAGSVE
jgi:antirestriction protein ArdC